MKHRHLAKTIHRQLLLAVAALGLQLLMPRDLHAQKMGITFTNWTIQSVGNLSGLDQNAHENVGRTFIFQPGTSNTVLFADYYVAASMPVMQATVQRNANGSVTNLVAGSIHQFGSFANAGQASGSLASLPGGTLVYPFVGTDASTGNGSVILGQILPGQTTGGAFINLGQQNAAWDNSAGDALSVLAVVPPGMTGAGGLKLLFTPAGGGGPAWYSVSYTTASNGTLSVTGLTASPASALNYNFSSDLSEMAFVPPTPSRSQLTNASLLVALSYGFELDAYNVDTNNNPIPSSLRVFATATASESGGNLSGVAVDPVTSDILMLDDDGNLFRVFPAVTSFTVSLSISGTPNYKAPGEAYLQVQVSPSSIVLNQALLLDNGATFETNGGGSLNFLFDAYPLAAGTHNFSVVGISGGISVTSSVVTVVVTNVLPSVTLLNPTNGFVLNICQPVSFALTAQTVAGSYPINYVAYYDGANLIGQSSVSPYSVVGSALGAGLHQISAQVVDTGGFSAGSQVANVTLIGPSLNQMLAVLAANGDVIGCMGTQPGSNYVIQMATNLQAPIVWRPLLTNRVTGSILLFTNIPTLPNQFYRGRITN